MNQISELFANVVALGIVCGLSLIVFGVIGWVLVKIGKAIAKTLKN